MRLAVALLLLSFPAIAQGPDLSLLEAREIPYFCEDGGCRIREADLKFLMARDTLISSLLAAAIQRLRSCRYGAT